MKKLLIMCGAGHATSTVAVAKISDYLKEQKLFDKVQIRQSTISEEINRLDDYDVVVCTTIVPDSAKDKVINGFPLLSGMGLDEFFETIKQQILK